jgi:hypothetical protein
MDHLQTAVAMLHDLLLRNSPETFNSTWILERAPRCYSLIRKHIRSEIGGIDWDTITCALEPKYQRRWIPQQRRRAKLYTDSEEISLIRNKYRNKFYVFIAQAYKADLQIRDKIAVVFVRAAQAGNLLARDELVGLIRHTIDGWLENYSCMSSWRGREDQIREQLDGCIRRYRYSGSFLRYLFCTLEYAARGIPSLYVCSLDDPIAAGSSERKVERVIHDPETNGIVRYKPRNVWSFDSDSRPDGG